MQGELDLQDDERDEENTDPARPSILLLNHVDHEGVVSVLKASKQQYKKRMLDSNPENWESISDYFDQMTIAGVLLKLTANTFRQLSSPEYAAVRERLFANIANSRHMVFAYEDLLTGRPQSKFEEEYRPHPPLDKLDEVLRWLGQMSIEAIPYKTNAELTVLATAFVDDAGKNLIARFYIPVAQVWSRETDRFLQLFREYLVRVASLKIRLDERRTDRGTIYEFHGEGRIDQKQLSAHFREFSVFMDTCAEDIEAAEAILRAKAMDHAAATQIVSEYGKEARRLQLDLKHEQERRFLAIRQRMESELAETFGGPVDWELVQSVAMRVLPGPVPFFSARPLLQSGETTGSPNITVNLSPQIIHRVEGIVAQELRGNVNLAPEAQKVLELIAAFTPANADELNSAVHEVGDKGAPPADRLGAAQKLKAFLMAVGKRGADVATGVLQSYIEKQLGL